MEAQKTNSQDQATQVSPKFNPERYLWLKGQLSTDLMNIDEELMRIAVLVQDANENAAVASELYDSAKEKSKVVYAQTAAKIRLELRPDGKAKTEGQVDAETTSSPECSRQQAELSDARLDASLWNSMTEGLRTKAYSLKAIAELITSGYVTKDYAQEKYRAQIRQASPRT